MMCGWEIFVEMVMEEITDTWIQTKIKSFGSKKNKSYDQEANKYVNKNKNKKQS